MMTTDLNKKTEVPRILLSAFGIHTGGGLVLLKILLKQLNGKLKMAALDSRFIMGRSLKDLNPGIEYIRRSFLARILALGRLSRMTSPGDVLLCFNSLPPLRRAAGRVIIFVQAPHFIGAHKGIRYGYLTSTRLMIERLWFKLGVRNCDEIWVQTPTIRELILRNYPGTKVKVVALVDSEMAMRLAVQFSPISKKNNDDSNFSFFYPADGVGHKNHENLYKAWALLASDGRTPELILTLREEEMASLKKRTQLGDDKAIRVKNFGWLTRDETLAQLRKSSALIFPSRAETFGLPLLEARSFVVPILASERDFVRDVCAPVQTFDPDSPRSIAMAVARFMDGDVALTADYYSAQRFVEELDL